MTSTPFNVGLGDGSRLSSRVLRPPGGGHTDIFGSTEPEQPQNRGRRPAASCISGPVEKPVKPTNGTESSNQNGNQQEQLITIEPVQEVTPVVEAKTENSAQNNIPIDKSDSTPQKRIRVPPGGFSTGFCNE